MQPSRAFLNLQTNPTPSFQKLQKISGKKSILKRQYFHSNQPTVQIVQTKKKQDARSKRKLNFNDFNINNNNIFIANNYPTKVFTKQIKSQQRYPMLQGPRKMKQYVPLNNIFTSRRASLLYNTIEQEYHRSQPPLQQKRTLSMIISRPNSSISTDKHQKQQHPVKSINKQSQLNSELQRDQSINKSRSIYLQTLQSSESGGSHRQEKQHLHKNQRFSSSYLKNLQQLGKRLGIDKSGPNSRPKSSKKLLRSLDGVFNNKSKS